MRDEHRRHNATSSPTLAGADVRIFAGGRYGFRKTLIGILTVGLLLTAVVGWALYDSHRMAWSNAVNTSSNLVTALQRDLGHTIGSFDLSLKAALRGLQAPELAQLSPQTRQALLFDGSIEAKHIGSVFIIGTDGRILDDSGQIASREGVFSDRDYFLVHRDRSDVGLYLSTPHKGRLTGEWSIAISRRVNGEDGSFQGVVVGSIQFSYFAELFSRLSLDQGASISLFRTDGTLLYRTPFIASQIGQDFGAASVFQEIRAGRYAPYEGLSHSDGQLKLFAFSAVDDLPLLLSIGTATDAIYADWRVKAVLTCMVLGVLLVTGACLMVSARSKQLRCVRAERATARSARLLQAYFDHSPDSLFVVSVGSEGRLTYERINPACAAMTGVPVAAAAGKSPGELFAPEVAAAVEQSYRTGIESGQVYAYEETRMLPTGRRDLHAVLCPIRDENGVISLLLGSARDMTAENQREAERRQAGKMEAVGRLTAGVAHDFNNYLQTISGSLEVLASDGLTAEESREYQEMAQKASASGARLTHRLLAFSRQQVLRPRRVSVATLLTETRKMVGSAGFGPGIHFKIVVEPFTQDIQVDPVQAESCLLNLLFNARDAMPAGGNLVLHARNARPIDGVCGTVHPDNTVIVAVHDSGSGMDEVTKARAFEPFFTTKAFGKGSGLGLSMVQGFCHQSGGEVRILSGGDVGTRIELWLPAASAAAAAGEEVNSNITSLGRTTGRILLVEDERDVCLTLAASLVSGGLEVVTVTNGRDGLARLGDRDPYDALITDYEMPDMSGAKFLLLAAQRVPQTPMLIISGSDVDAAEWQSLQHPVTLLRKPILRAELLAAVREAIARRKTALAA